MFCLLLLWNSVHHHTHHLSKSKPGGSHTHVAKLFQWSGMDRLVRSDTVKRPTTGKGKMEDPAVNYADFLQGAATEKTCGTSLPRRGLLRPGAS